MYRDRRLSKKGIGEDTEYCEMRRYYSQGEALSTWSYEIFTLGKIQIDKTHTLSAMLHLEGEPLMTATAAFTRDRFNPKCSNTFYHEKR